MGWTQRTMNRWDGQSLNEEAEAERGKRESEGILYSLISRPPALLQVVLIALHPTLQGRQAWAMHFSPLVSLDAVLLLSLHAQSLRLMLVQAPPYLTVIQPHRVHGHCGFRAKGSSREGVEQDLAVRWFVCRSEFGGTSTRTGRPVHSL